MANTKKQKTQMALELPPAAPTADLEQAVQIAEASFRAAPAAGVVPVLPQSTVSEPPATPQLETAPKPVVDAVAPRFGRETLYVVAAVKWGPVRMKRGSRDGWQRLPDAGFKGQTQAVIAAERMVEAGRATGAMAIKQTADIDAGEYDEPVILARYGRVPEEMTEL